MRAYYGDVRRSQTLRIPFNTVNTSGVLTTLTSGAVTISKDGTDITPSGGVTLTTDVGSVTGRHRVTIDTSADAVNFTAGSDYTVRLSGSSAVGSTSVAGIILGTFSIENRAVLVDASGRVTLTPGSVQAIWDALTSALTTVGSIGKLLVDNLNATIASRLASAGYTAPDNTNIAAIKVKTDLLPSSPAAVGSAMTLAADAVNAAALATDAVDEIKSGLATETAVSGVQTTANTINSKLGAITGSGLNTVLGFFRALASKAGAILPTDIGGTFDNTTDSLEAIRDRGDAAWGGGGGGGLDPDYGTLTAQGVLGEPIFTFFMPPTHKTVISASENVTIRTCLSVSVVGGFRALDPTVFDVELSFNEIGANDTPDWFATTWTAYGAAGLTVGPDGAVELTAGKRYEIWARTPDETATHNTMLGIILVTE